MTEKTKTLLITMALVRALCGDTFFEQSLEEFQKDVVDGVQEGDEPDENTNTSKPD